MREKFETCLMTVKIRSAAADEICGRRPEAFTLVEAVVSLVIVSGMLVAALSAVGASRLS